MNRRDFLAGAMMTAAADADAAPQLAVNGGTPVRTKPLTGPNWGPQYYDDKEQTQLNEVLEGRNPFRFSNPLDRSKVAAFENEYATRMRTKYALAVTSGTAALHTAMAALEVGPGDEVILPAWTWYSCYNTIIQAGALPVFAEIDESFNLDPAGIEALITPQTKVIMVVHLQGNPADLDPILQIARRHGLKVLEDASQSVGATYKGRPLGSMGDIGIYSLQQSKTITAGEGGAVVTGDAYLYERACRFHDITVRRDFPTKLRFLPGLNYRMNEFTGGVLLAQLRKLDTIIGDVRRNARRVYRRNQRSARHPPAPPARSGGRTGHGHFSGLPHEGSARPLRTGYESRRRPRHGAGGFGDSAGCAGDRAESDGDAALAVIRQRTRAGHPLRTGMLSTHHRYIEPVRRGDDESEIH